MKPSLPLLIQSLKKLFREQEKLVKAQSFVLMFGKQRQGLGSLLNQSSLNHYPVDKLAPASLYYNQQGVILQLPEEWLMQNNELLADTLRQIDRCYPPLGITAVAMTVSINELLIEETPDYEERLKAHQQLWQWWQSSLPRPIPGHIILTHADVLPGFCEFFQRDFRPEHRGLLGFYCPPVSHGKSQFKSTRLSFQRLLQQLDQQVLEKLHPVRSTLKRTLIREFPLQLQALGTPLMQLLQRTGALQSGLRAIYFTSSRQGGNHLDAINRKIKHEYALCLPSRVPQAPDSQHYFVDACLQDILKCNKMALPANRKTLRNLGFAAAAAALLTLTISTRQYWHNTQQLDAVSRELLQYEQLAQSRQDSLSALYHLGQANEQLQHISNGLFVPASLFNFQQNLNQQAREGLRRVFMPELLEEAEQAVRYAASPTDRFAALKTYIMLGDPTHFDREQLTGWFERQWANRQASDKHLLVLEQSLRQPLQLARLNDGVIQDARNALNALPDAYFYYSLARQYFPSHSRPLVLPGFTLPQKNLPFLYTREGFASIVEKIDSIVDKIQQEKWVTERQPPNNLRALILETYAYEYHRWWKNFLSQSRIDSINSYQEMEKLLKTLRENDSFSRLIRLAQQHTSPVSTDASGFFNQYIARSFAQLSWLGGTPLQSLKMQQADLETFSRHLDLLHSQPESLLELTQQRFTNPQHSDPLSVLYHSSQRYPSPLKEWNKQLADSLWFLLIQDSKKLIEEKWHTEIASFYQEKIASKYPFSSRAIQEVRIDDFRAFFKPGGKLQQFNRHYLSPFMDTRHAQWKAREINGFHLPLQPETIQQLMVANILQTMFFDSSNSDDRLHFTMENIALDPMVKACNLQIGAREMRNQQDQVANSSEFIWPADGASLELQALDGQTWRLTEKGPWALFHLLDKVNVIVDENDPTSLQILFEINGNSGRYALHTNYPINPFTPGIFGQFHLPEQL